MTRKNSNVLYPCPKCGAERAYRKSYCEPCQAAYGWAHRCKKYGISVEQAASHLARIQHRCEICKLAKELCFDHDHNTGLFRGFLCLKCNGAIAIFDDAPLHAAAETYLASAQKAT